MKNKIKYIFLYPATLLFLLIGCADTSNEEYNEAISNGLDELRMESYEKAEEYFDRALEEEPGDERAETLLRQTQNYVEAVSFFEQEKFNESVVKAEIVLSLEDGSEYLEFKTSELVNEIQSIQETKVAAEHKEQSEKELFEEIKGVYATFARGIYEWPVDYQFIIGDDFIINGYQQTGLYTSEITDRKFEGDTLILDTVIEGESSNKKEQYIIDVSYNEQNEKTLGLETGEVLYPITVDEAIETGFGLINGSFSSLDKLRGYDDKVTQTVSYSNTVLLNDYSAEEIEYARVWLNTIENVGVTELNVSREKAGNIINHYDENSPVYPEDVTVITGFYTADGMVIYSGNGDGTINIYPVPSHWHAPPEDLPELYEEILNPAKVYIEPLNDEKVIPLIQKININF